MQRIPTAGGPGSWVVLDAGAGPDEERMLVIYPAPLGSVDLYLDGQPQRRALDLPGSLPAAHGRLAWALPAGAGPWLLHFAPTTTLSAPVGFQITPVAAFAHADARWLALTSASLAVMLAMVLMGLCFALMLRDDTYLWYALYVGSYALIQATQTGYLSNPLGWHLALGESVLGPALVVSSVTFAIAFMLRFCQLKRYVPLLRLPLLALAGGLAALMLLRLSRVPVLVEIGQTLLNPSLILGAVLLLTGAVACAWRGSRAAWFFLAGWTPLLVLTALASAQTDGALPALPWLNDATILAGAGEALLLSLGLADRTLFLRRDRDHVQALAAHDPLTGVLNRRAFSERAAARLNSGVPRPIALLFLDLDRFKLLNDSFGHHAGDRALTSVAKVLADELRPDDLLGRWGGEEFVVLLDGSPTEQARQVATRLCRRVYRLEIPVTDNGILLSISVGAAMLVEGDDVESLVSRADKAMYEAKSAGRNRVQMQSSPRRGAHLHVVAARQGWGTGRD